ncbi:helix-turn-helix domain-containing protein [Rhodococcus oxybenzonivorans]|uniref:helix-turn-helix domain-containing protein n=1 Tax=Rhodococcus oxybenzonivorans TaxID=1990687 RepID=UPI0026BBDC1E
MTASQNVARAPILIGRPGHVRLHLRRQPELALSDMARRADLPVPTTHRLAADLLDWGALERDAAAATTSGSACGRSPPCPRGLVLRELALPVMEDLTQITHENVQLGVRDGTVTCSSVKQRLR